MSTQHNSFAKKSSGRIKFRQSPSHASGSARSFSPFSRGHSDHVTPNPLDRTGGQMGHIETAKLVLH